MRWRLLALDGGMDGMGSGMGSPTPLIPFVGAVGEPLLMLSALRLRLPGRELRRSPTDDPLRPLDMRLPPER